MLTSSSSQPTDRPTDKPNTHCLDRVRLTCEHISKLLDQTMHINRIVAGGSSAQFWIWLHNCPNWIIVRPHANYCPFSNCLQRPNVLNFNSTKLKIASRSIWCDSTEFWPFVVVFSVESDRFNFSSGRERMDFDNVLNDVGSFGLYQKIVIAVLMPAVLPCAFHAYSQLFIASMPNHWCRVPELEQWSSRLPNLVKNLSIPMVLRDGQMKYSQCQMYSRNYTEIVGFLHTTDTSTINDNGEFFFEPLDYAARNFETVDCKNGWIYDRAMFPNTVVMEVKLECLIIRKMCCWNVCFRFSGILSATETTMPHWHSFYSALVVSLAITCMVFCKTTGAEDHRSSYIFV